MTVATLDDPRVRADVSSRWLHRYRHGPDGGIRLFCIPCAGHGASMYAGWAAHLSRGVELWGLQPPGRENRLDEAALPDMDALVAAAAAGLDPLLDDRPFAFVGHSLGALVAFELTRELRRRGRPLPRRLLVSAYPAPQRPRLRPPRCNLPDMPFLSSIRGMNTAMADDDDYFAVLRLMLPTLRADFTLCERYVYRDAPPLPCDITVWGGEDDEEAPLQELVDWREQTSAAFSLQMFGGDHFFVMTQKHVVLRALAQWLAPLL